MGGLGHRSRLTVLNCRFDQQGSALSEVILLVFVLAPLMYAVVVVGKFVDLRQQSVVGARFVAWEHAVGSEAESTLASVQQFLGGSVEDNAIPPSVGGGDGRSQRSLTAAPLGHREARARLESTRVSIGSVDVASDAGHSTGVEAAISALSNGNTHTTVANDLMHATLGIDVDDNPWLGNWLGSCAGDHSGSACLSESSSIYLDDWSAANDDEAIDRVSKMIPSTVLQPLGRTLSLVGRLPWFEELTPLDTAFGHVDMSVLPESRERLSGSVDDGPDGAVSRDLRAGSTR